MPLVKDVDGFWMSQTLAAGEGILLVKLLTRKVLQPLCCAQSLMLCQGHPAGPRFVYFLCSSGANSATELHQLVKTVQTVKVGLMLQPLQQRPITDLVTTSSNILAAVAIHINTALQQAETEFSIYSVDVPQNNWKVLFSNVAEGYAASPGVYACKGWGLLRALLPYRFP